MQQSSPLSVVRTTPLDPINPAWKGLRGRYITGDPGQGNWDEYLLSEWEFEKVSWGDRHPYDEFNFVLAGELHIEVDGETVMLGPGDSATVSAGTLGRYFAPEYARTITIYGANPQGLPSTDFDYQDL